MRFVTGKDNVNIFVNDIGSGEPVVFLHGWPANNNMFEAQKNELLEKGYRYVGVDFRGYGKSDAPASGYDYNTMADDVKAVFDELGLNDATLLGFSMGGAIAIRYLSRYGGHGVKKLILAGAAAPIFTQRDDYPYGLKKEDVDGIIQSTKEDRPAMIENFGGMFFGKEPSEPYKQWFQGLSFAASSHGTINSAIALRDEDLRGDLASINVPTAIFHGEKDEVCPFDFAKEMEKGIADSHIVPFAESGHGMFSDERDKFTAEILTFLQK